MANIYSNGKNSFYVPAKKTFVETICVTLSPFLFQVWPALSMHCLLWKRIKRLLPPPASTLLPHFHTTSTPVGAMGIFFQRTHLTRETQNSKRTWLENDEDDDKRTMIDENKDYDCEVFNDDPKYNKMQEDHDIIIWKKLF